MPITISGVACSQKHFYIQKIEKIKRPLKLFQQLYSFDMKHRILYPIAKRSLKKELPELQI